MTPHRHRRCDGVDRVQGPDTLGDRQRADATAASIAVSRKGGGVLSGGTGAPDVAGGKLPAKAQHTIVVHSEHTVDTRGLEAIRQVLDYSRVIHDIRPRT